MKEYTLSLMTNNLNKINDETETEIKMYYDNKPMDVGTK